jgi:hypothetical protein
LHCVGPIFILFFYNHNNEKYLKATCETSTHHFVLDSTAPEAEMNPDEIRKLMESLFSKECTQLMATDYYNKCFPTGEPPQIWGKPTIIMPPCQQEGPDVCLVAMYRRRPDETSEKWVQYDMHNEHTVKQLRKLAEDFGTTRHVVDYRRRVVMWFDTGEYPS